jgi:hypothetical protein
MVTFNLDIKGIRLDEAEFNKMMADISYTYKEDVLCFITRAIKWQVCSDYNDVNGEPIGEFDPAGNLIPYCEKCHYELRSEIKVL